MGCTCSIISVMKAVLLDHSLKIQNAKNVIRYVLLVLPVKIALLARKIISFIRINATLHVLKER